MAMRFSEHGPDIPEALIEGCLSGDVVFVCGAGVSKRADLPLFIELVENIYTRLAETRTDGEQVAFRSGRYEETLGALSRRLADPRRMLRAVEEELAARGDANLSAHDTILRLSRDLEGKPILVTTNFDTLFERRLSQTAAHEPAVSLSHAGAQVPAPGGLRFNGVIHLHGRLADAELGIDATDLVLTSADFGDAYLRSGWAARFLFDLCRCRTIVLVGYTANDPPVRYILNIIEADRARFPELRDVYAFTGDDGAGNAAAAWETVAVEPIPYPAPEHDHSHLWRDLGTWSELAADPRQWRAARLTDLLAREPHDLLPWEREQVAWILKHSHVAGAVAGENISEAWIAFIGERELITSDGALRWSVGQWAARRLANISAFSTMVGLVDKLRPETGDEILRGLRAVNPGQVPTFLVTGWRLLVESLTRRSAVEFWKKHYAEKRVEDGTALGPDLAELIKPLVPTMRLRSARPYVVQDEPTELSHVCEVNFEPTDDHGEEDVLCHVREGSALVWPLLRRASEALIGSLDLAVDAERIRLGFDVTDYDVPSVAQHAQNEHRNGFLPVVRLCAELWLRAARIDAGRARSFAQSWKSGGLRITSRLWLFTSLGDPERSSTSMASALLELGQTDFWRIHKEAVDLLKAIHLSDAGHADALIARILQGPDDLARLELELQQRVRDREIWIRLMALREASALPEAAERELQSIIERNGWRQRLTEPEYFSMWMGRVIEGPIGDPVPLEEAATEQRVEIATRLERDDPLHQTDVWRAYCSSDPTGALQSLIAVGPAEPFMPRWRDLLWSVSRPDERNVPVLTWALNHLDGYTDENLVSITHPLTDAYVSAVERQIAVEDRWWDRLWCLAEQWSRTDQVGRRDPGYALISNAMNAPGGKLTRLLVRPMGPRWNDLSVVERETIERRLGTVVGSDTTAGLHGRAIAVELIAWLHHYIPQLISGPLKGALGADSPEGIALRSILVGMSRSVGTDLRFLLRDEVFRGVEEHQSDESAAVSNAASRVVAEALDDLKREPTDAAKLGRGHAKHVLTEASDGIRSGAATVLGEWLAAVPPNNQAAAWRDDYKPVFIDIWPLDKKYRSEWASRALAKFALAAGEGFPDAFDTIQPYLVPLTDAWPQVHFFTMDRGQEVIRAHPEKVLSLLWCLLRPPVAKGRSTDIPEILDALKEADHNLAQDRRLQLLEERAVR
jgi:hypothetical protein